MARDEHGNVIRHQNETEDDENLTEDEASSYSRQPKTRTGHTSKFPLITGDPSDMTHRQKKMHFKMILSHIQGSALYKDDLEKQRNHINNNPDRDGDAEDVRPLIECFDSDYITSMTPGAHVRVMEEWEEQSIQGSPGTRARLMMG